MMMFFKVTFNTLQLRLFREIHLLLSYNIYFRLSKQNISICQKIGKLSNIHMLRLVDGLVSKKYFTTIQLNSALVYNNDGIPLPLLHPWDAPSLFAFFSSCKLEPFSYLFLFPICKLGWQMCINYPISLGPNNSCKKKKKKKKIKKKKKKNSSCTTLV